MLDGLVCLLIKFANLLFAVLFSWWIDLLILMLSYLPQSPLKFEPIKWGVFGEWLGFFFPVSKMAAHFTTILFAVTMWYAVQHVLRILRMVR